MPSPLSSLVLFLVLVLVLVLFLLALALGLALIGIEFEIEIEFAIEFDMIVEVHEGRCLFALQSGIEGVVFFGVPPCAIGFRRPNLKRISWLCASLL